MTLCDVRLLKSEIEEYQRLQQLLEQGKSWQNGALKRRIKRISEGLAAVLWEITKLIEQMEDPEMRLIFELRYFRGLTWNQVAARLPTDLSGDAARVKHDRYLKQLKK